MIQSPLGYGTDKGGTEMIDKERIAEYNTVKLYFISYYKYTFYFKGETEDGKKIAISIGGIADNIYRFSVERDEPVYIEHSYPEIETIRVKDRDGSIIYEWYSWDDELG